MTDSGGCVVRASRAAGFSCPHILPNLQRTMAVMNDASERRAAQRFEIFAQANVVSVEDVYVMSVRNISGAGAFLEGLPEEHADLAPGVEIEVAISATALGMGDDEVLNIDCRGRVVRVELRSANSAGGFGISLEPKTAEDQERLGDLLDRLIDLPPDQRPSRLG